MFKKTLFKAITRSFKWTSWSFIAGGRTLRTLVDGGKWFAVIRCGDTHTDRWAGSEKEKKYIKRSFETKISDGIAN